MSTKVKITKRFKFRSDTILGVMHSSCCLTLDSRVLAISMLLDQWYPLFDKVLPKSAPVFRLPLLWCFGKHDIAPSRLLWRFWCVLSYYNVVQLVVDMTELLEPLDHVVHPNDLIRRRAPGYFGLRLDFHFVQLRVASRWGSLLQIHKQGRKGFRQSTVGGVVWYDHRISGSFSTHSFFSASGRFFSVLIMVLFVDSASPLAWG